MFFNKKLKAQLRNLQATNKALEVQLGWERTRRDAEVKVNMGLRFENGRLKEALKTKTEEPEVDTVKAERLVGIKFSALFNGKFQPTVFTIGPGNCGKNVKWFTVTHESTLLRIHQYHTDGSRKEFIYRTSDIDGRIQYDYESVELTGIDAATEVWNRKRESKSRLMGHGFPRVVNIKLPD